MDDEDQTGTIIYNPDGTFTMDGVTVNIPVIQGPPGPAATFELEDHSGFVDGIVDSLRAAHYGTRPVPELRFEVDGWEYAFPTKEHARMVREQLMKMTLEGEL